MEIAIRSVKLLTKDDCLKNFPYRDQTIFELIFLVSREWQQNLLRYVTLVCCVFQHTNQSYLGIGQRLVESGSHRAAATTGIRCREPAQRVQVAGGSGIGVKGQVVEDLKVGVEHEAGIPPVGLVDPVELPLGSRGLSSDILERVVRK